MRLNKRKKKIKSGTPSDAEYGECKRLGIGNLEGDDEVDRWEAIRP